MSNMLVPTEFLKSIHLHPIFFYLFMTTVVIYIATEIFLFGSKFFRKDNNQKPFRSEIIWFLVPVIFIISLVYAL